MLKRIGIGKSLLVYSSLISVFVLVISLVFLVTSEKAIESVMTAGKTGTSSLSTQSSLIKSMALVHSNILPLAAEADPDSQEIRIELVKGFIAEFKTLIEKCGSKCETLKPEVSKYEKEWDSIIADLAKNNMPSAASRILNALNPIAENLFDMLDKGATEVSRVTDVAFADAEVQSAKTKKTLITLIGLLVVSIFVAGFFFQKKLVQSINNVVEKVKDSVNTTNQKSLEIKSSTERLSQSSTRQAAAIEETVASIEELSNIIKSNAEHAKSAAEFSKQSTHAAREGGDEISILISSMKDISNSSKKIEEIIGVIDDIAFQTNLLALNAAVEAARAGEQGKGFAVVAEAVRSLAQRSAEAAKEISTIISTSVEQTERGTKVADNSAAALTKIIELIQKLETLNSEISVASQEQSQGITQLSQAMTEIDQVTQSNATVAEDLSTNSDVLSQQSHDLSLSTTDLEVLIQGRKGAANSSSSAD